MYDYLIVGAGLFGCTFANKAKRAGKKCLIVEKRPHIGGNCYTCSEDGIVIHKYGAHIFRTSNRYIWEWLKTFCHFNNFINTPIAISQKRAYNLPFNMNTFSELWGVTTPDEAFRIISNQRNEIKGSINNLEEKAISLVGRDIYLKFIKGYTEKQWGKDCKDLPASIIRRIPFRLTYDNNYFNDPFQGIPIGGYTQIFEKMIQGIPLELSTDFLADKKRFLKSAKKIIYTGPIDEFYNYRFGELEYRGLNFIEKKFDIPNVQGVAVFNYPDKEVPYTRSIEHKHFEFGQQPNSIISYEYPCNWKRGQTPYYPINDEKNERLYNKYLSLSKDEGNVIFCGRLGSYKYFDMQDTILSALKLVTDEISFEAATTY